MTRWQNAGAAMATGFVISAAVMVGMAVLAAFGVWDLSAGDALGGFLFSGLMLGGLFWLCDH